MEFAREEPGVVIACVGGGPNFGGLAIAFLRRLLRGEARTRFVAAELAARPALTRSVYAYDFGRPRRSASAGGVRLQIPVKRHELQVLAQRPHLFAEGEHASR